jgi:hypothetical protein
MLVFLLDDHGFPIKFQYNVECLPDVYLYTDSKEEML